LDFEMKGPSGWAAVAESDLEDDLGTTS